mgnify:CR=1 FL=1|tara:strand:+ start:2338 stop:3291 length:954 start_codon:yes stop_codon:yes gene_type:complete
MATQQVRNIVNNQIDALLGRAETQLRNSGKNKFQEFQNQLMTPDSITKILQVPANNNSCSDRGLAKYEKSKTKITEKLMGTRDTVSSIKEKLDNLDLKVRPIVDGEGAIGQILYLKDSIIKPYMMPALKALNLAIPVALFVLKGLLADLSIGTTLYGKLRVVKSKIKEIEALLGSISGIIEFYQERAHILLIPLDKSRNKLGFIILEIDKLLAFITSLHLNHIGQCDTLENASNVSVNSDTMTGGNEDGDSSENNNIIPDPLGPTPLDEYLSLLENQYNDVYQQILNSNMTKYTERMFALKENLEEDYNIRFKNINL